MQLFFVLRQSFFVCIVAFGIVACQTRANKNTANQNAAAVPPNILFIIADDWSYPHASIYGDSVVRTPNFDRIAREGMLFTNAYCAAPSCTPSRAAILTGHYPHRLREGANLWGFLPDTFPNYTQSLEKNGYAVGLTGKGWGPGKPEKGGYTDNPAGPRYENFAKFFRQLPKGKPFCFWYGSTDPHRPYEPGTGQALQKNAYQVKVPPFLPDNKVVREDLLDYYFEVERFDRQIGDILSVLEKAGQLDNTLIGITGDNGMPFPRAKANLYDSGSRVPLAIRYPAKIKKSGTNAMFVNLIDLMPTFLEAANIAVPEGVDGRSLMPLLTGAEDETVRDKVFLERERHAYVRAGNAGYPSRAVRTTDFLYIRNALPDRWPAGDPEMVFAVGAYGDVDPSPSKDFLLVNRSQKSVAPFFTTTFAKRPAEELYDLRNDPYQLKNVANESSYAHTLTVLRLEIDNWQWETHDPRARGEGAWFDQYPYYGTPAAQDTTVFRK